MPRPNPRPLSPMSAKDIQRFWSRATILGPDDCWLWKRSTYGGGYGHFWYGKKAWSSNRVAYFISRGVDPGPLLVLHSCDVRRCVNPAHLSLGDDMENVAQMFARGRANNPSGDASSARLHPEALRRGASHPKAKLTDAEVLMIRALYSPGKKGNKLEANGSRGLAVKFSVEHQTILAIVNRKTWKHI